MLENPYSYLFYRIYSWKLRHEEKSLALFVALALTAIVLTHNLFIMTVLLMEWVLENGSVTERSQLMALGTASTVAIGALLYFYWIRCRRYEGVFNIYNAESLKERRLRTVLMIIHVALTFASNIVVPILIYESRSS